MTCNFDMLTTIIADQVPVTLDDRAVTSTRAQADLDDSSVLILDMRGVLSCSADLLGGVGGAEGK